MGHRDRNTSSVYGESPLVLVSLYTHFTRQSRDDDNEDEISMVRYDTVVYGREKNPNKSGKRERDAS